MSTPRPNAADPSHDAGHTRWVPQSAVMPAGKVPRMNAPARRLSREQRTIDAMIAIYCRDHHARTAGLCGECGALRAYAAERLARCPFGTDKPTCLNCKVHCYRNEQRERVRSVMRYAGLRMLRRHPLLTVLHMYWDARREAPVKASRTTAA